MKIIPKSLIMILSHLILAFLLAGCNGNKKSTKQSGSDSNQTAKEEIQSPPEPQPAPAPGTAVVQGLVRSVDESQHSVTCIVEIEKINGYGAGTPALSKGSAISIDMAQSQYEKNKKELKPDKSLLMVISSSKNVQLQRDEKESSRAEWTLVSIK